jgi:hypothetical protein
MSDSDKFGLFLVIVGLGLLASKASARLGQEVGVPALVITAFAGIVSHGIARELPG